MLHDVFEIRTVIIGHDEESKKQFKVLNRFISVEDGEYAYEPDVRLSEMIVKELGLQGLSTPVSDVLHESVELLHHERFK